METNVIKERLAFVHDLGERPLVDDRAVRALRGDPSHGLQVAGTASSRRWCKSG